MKDAMTKGKTAAIEITKELKLNDALAGAKDMTFYAALFADAECTIPASDVKSTLSLRMHLLPQLPLPIWILEEPTM